MRNMFVRTRFGIPAFWQIAAGVIVLLGGIALIVVAAMNDTTWLLAVGFLLVIAAGVAVVVGVTAVNRAEEDARQRSQAELTGEAVARLLRPGTQDR